MVDYTARGEEEKKKTGCLGMLFVIILILGGLAAAAYFLLPSLLARSSSGGIVYKMLPDEMQEQFDQFQYMVDDNISQMEKYGLDSYELTRIVESVDFGTVENLVDDIERSAISDTNELLDIINHHISIPREQLDKIKRDYYSEISQDDLDRMITRFRESPMIMRTGFSVFKETLLKSLESEDKVIEMSEPVEPPPLEETPAEESSAEETSSEESSGGSSTTKKKK